MYMNLDTLIKKHSAFTLIELVVAIVVLSIGATAFLTLINQATRKSIDPVIIQQANAIAQSYLEEIMLNPFCDPDLSNDCPAFCSAGAGNVCTVCTASEANRSLYDDVCDYSNLTDSAGAVDRNLNPLSGLGDYNITVTVEDGSVSGPATLNTLSSSNNEVLRVDVNVTHDNISTLDFTLSGYRANF